MAKKRRRKWHLKESVKRFLIYSLAIILILIYAIIESVKLYKELQYHKTDEYKIILVGYKEEESKKFISLLSDDDINFILDNEYNELYINLLNEKYFISDNFQEYIKEQTKRKKESLTNIVSLVNTKASYGTYNNIIDTDITKGDLILVNKNYKLPEDYKREDIIPASLSYSYYNNSASEKVLEAFEQMNNKIIEELDIKLMINRSYKSYDEIEKGYNDYKNISIKYADNNAWRPGHSEHQTGLALDLSSSEHQLYDTFIESKEYEWLLNNSYKYGFILRYPKDKEDITGCDYELNHFRYVGIDVATKIHNENITFDEYYAYYIQNK